MTLEKQQNYAGEQNYSASVVETHGQRNAGLALCCLELFESRSGQVGRNAGVTSWGVTSSDSLAGFEAEAFDLLALQFSSVVSAWGRSCEDGEFFAFGKDLECVFSVDGIDFVPAESESPKWVDNADSFVEQLELWANINEPGTCARETAETRAGQGGFGVTFRGDNSEEADENRAHDASENVARFRAESLNVVHQTIFSQSNNEPLLPTQERK